MKFFLLIIGASSLAGSGAYVLLQVRKGDNQSNVDALIHKVVPTGRIERIAGAARKQFDKHKYSAHNRHAENRDPTKQDRNGLESIVVAIDSGASPNSARGKPDAFDRVVQKLSSVLQEGAMNMVPKYRAELEKFHIKPEIVHFRSGKPSVMFEINTKAVMQSLQEFLASKEVKEYTDRVASQAAMLYRSVTDEIMRE